MDEYDRFAQIVKQRSENAKLAHIRFVECTSVDQENKTMDAKGTGDESEYFDVMLGLGFSYVIPAIGSICLIGIIDSIETATFLINAESVESVEVKMDKLQFNGGLNMGLVKIKELTDRLNKIEQAFNSLLNEFRRHNHLHPQGATTGLVSPILTQALSLTEQKEIEDNTIIH